MKRILTILVCVGVLGVSPATLNAQRARDNFFSLEGRFRINLPRATVEWRPSTMVAAKQLLSISLYKWNTTSGLLTAGYAVTGVDLEDAKVANKIFQDARDAFVRDYKAKLLSEHNRVFDGHQGFEFIIENKSLLTAVRIILVKNRFYMLTLTNRPDQRDLMANGERLLSTFRLMSVDEVLAERERSLEALPASPYTQTVVGTDTRPDTQNDNLKGRVRQIFVERETEVNGVSFGERRPELVKEFSEDGYVMRAITFSGQWPATISLYGFQKGARVFNKALMSEMTWRFGRRPPNVDPADEPLHVVKQKYDSTGRLIEQVVYDEFGFIEERVGFKYDDDRREIETRSYSTVFGDRFETLSRTVERLDDARNPIELTVYQYSPGLGGSTTSMTVPVDPHDRVSGAITSGPLNSSSVKNSSNPTVPVRSEISRDRPLNSGSKDRPEERKVVTVSKTQTKVVEQKFAYTYEFDAQGNWIKRTIASKDKSKLPIDVTYRRITYY